MKLTKNKTLILFDILLLVCQGVNAQLSIDAQMRFRGEIRDGYQQIKPENSAPAILVSQRTRLMFMYEISKLKLKISCQDFRLWGEQAQINTNGTTNNAMLNVNDAYAEIDIGKSLNITAGKQELGYDSKRLIGERNWNRGYSYDALVIKFEPPGWNIHTGTSWNTLSEILCDNHYPSTNIKSLNFLWLSKQLNEQLKLSLLHISSGKTKSDSVNSMNFTHTSGVYGIFKTESICFWANAYYQYGYNQTGNKVKAGLIDTDLSLITGNITQGIGFSYLSGNNKVPGPDVTDRLFDPLNGSRHAFNGMMDYFTNYSVHTGQGGLTNFYLWLNYKFSENISVKNCFHMFNLASTNELTLKDKSLGKENDLTLKYKFSEWGNLEAGFAFFIHTKTLKKIQKTDSDNFNQFFYLQLLITPNILKNR